jgi:hypothetical protein
MSSLSYSITPEINIHKIKKQRCPNGTYRNKQTGNCEPKNTNANANTKKKRCPKGTHRNKQTGNCQSKNTTTIKRCPKGTFRNKKTGNCEAKKKSIKSVSNHKHQQRIIQRFMLNSKNIQKRRTLFLKSVCSDTGVCIAFGQETKKINDYFGGFIQFNHVTGIKQIGKPSSNGFVLEIQYTKEDYNAHTILKNSIDQFSDNLAYEYFVGQYINKKSKFFPCFLETYGLFLRKNAKITNLQNELSLISNKNESEINQNSCQDSEKLSLLIQHISNANTIHDKIQNPDFNENDLLYVLYQIYMPLMCLQNEFTHYDLHSENVLLYEPVIGKYIQYHYFVDDIEIKFKSRYIAKIIDYGRCYFFDTATNNSKIIHNKICSEAICEPRCGDNYGYEWLQGDPLTEDNYYTDSTQLNVSNDLRLLEYIKRSNLKTIPDFLNTYLQKVQYGIGIYKNSNKIYGTEPNINSGIPNTINNVQDAYWMLEPLVDNSTTRKQNDQVYANMTKLGDLYIFKDKPMQFTPFSSK